MQWPPNPNSKTPHKERITVVERDGLKCRTCPEIRAIKLTLDHIVPLSMGGSVGIENLQILCESCHKKKDRTTALDGYKGRIRFAKEMTNFQRDRMIAKGKLPIW